MGQSEIYLQIQNRIFLLFLIIFYRNGNIWVLFKDINGATKANAKLNNRYFNDSKIECYFVDEESFPEK